MNIQCIYYVYTECRLRDGVCAYICYMHVIYISYMPSIYFVYPLYIPCICRPQAYPLDIPPLYQMGLFSTFFYNDMPMIYQVHSMNVLGIWMCLVYHWHIIIKRVQNKPVWYRLGISKRYAWGLHIQWIFIVYTMYIHGIYIVYTMMSTYTLYMFRIYYV